MSLRNRHLALFLCVCAAWLGTVAHAQVVRCTDTRTGKVTYTDGACTGGAAAREVEARKTPEELHLEREQAAEALERKQQRLQAEATAAETEARRNAERDRARAAQAAAAAPQPQDYARSPECARSRRNFDMVAAGLSRSTYEQELRLEAAQRQVDLDCLGPQGYAEVEKARANQPRVVVFRPPGTALSTPTRFPRLVPHNPHHASPNVATFAAPTTWATPTPAQVRDGFPGPVGSAAQTEARRPADATGAQQQALPLRLPAQPLGHAGVAQPQPQFPHHALVVEPA